MANSPEEWYNSLPKITKFYLTTCFLTTCLCALGFLNPYQLHLDFDMVWHQFQLWRFFTCFIFLGNFSFPFLIKLFILVQYSTRLEADPFPAGGGPTADYVFMLLFGGAMQWIISYFMGFPFLGASMVFMIVYCWSRREPEMPVSVWGFKMKGLYLPWALMAFQVLIGGSPVMDLVGVAAGHVFYFLLEVMPAKQGGNPIIKTPALLANWFPSPQVAFATASGPVYRQGPAAAPPAQARHSWGTGRSLGSN